MRRNDEDIKKDIEDQFQWDGRVSRAKIEVEILDGNVKLSGEVPHFLAKRAAVEDSGVVPGVLNVDDKLVIKYNGDIVPLNDEAIKANIMNVLAWYLGSDSRDIKASVKEEDVLLEGKVNAYWKKSAAEEITSSVPGVSRVTSKINIMLKEKAGDEVIKKNIMAAVGRNAHIQHPENIEIEVKRGVVTLKGTVENFMEHGEAEDIAEYTSGVVDVVNDIVVRSV